MHVHGQSGMVSMPVGWTSRVLSSSSRLPWATPFTLSQTSDMLSISSILEVFFHHGMAVYSIHAGWKHVSNDGTVWHASGSFTGSKADATSAGDLYE